MRLYVERKLCIKCGLAKLVEFSKERDFKFDVDEEYKNIIDDE